MAPVAIDISKHVAVAVAGKQCKEDRGIRLSPYTDYLPKPILPIAGETIIDFIMDKVIELDNVESVIFIVGYLKDKMITHLQNKYKNVNMEFVEQTEYKGLAHAVSLTKPYINEDDDVFIILGDTIFDVDIKAVIEKGENALATFVVDDPSRFGVALLDGQKVIKVVEKPQEPISNLALTGLYYIKDAFSLFDAIDYIIKNDIKTKDEYQITDAIEFMISRDVYFSTFNLSGWYDCGEKSAMIETNREIISHKILTSESNIKSSTIIQPCFIGKNVIIENSTVGPFVSIDENSTIKGSTIKDSIIYAGVNIDNKNLENEMFMDLGTNIE